MRQIYYYNKLQCNLIGIMSNLKLNSIFKTVCIASDHAGFNLKEDIKNHLVNKKVSIYSKKENPIKENPIIFVKFPTNPK